MWRCNFVGAVMVVVLVVAVVVPAVVAAIRICCSIRCWYSISAASSASIRRCVCSACNNFVISRSI